MLPHREAAWILLAERVRQAADYCQPGVPCAPPVEAGLAAVQASLLEIAGALEAHLPSRGARAEPPVPAEAAADLLSRAEDFGQTGRAFTSHPDHLLSSVADLMGAADRVLQAHLTGAPTVARLVNSVLRPLAATLPAPSAPSPTLH